MTSESPRLMQIAGNAVASDSAFFIFVSETDAAWQAYLGSGGHIGGIVGGALGGLIGGILDGAVNKPRATIEQSRAVPASDLPQEFFDALGWPPSRVKGQHVLVFPFSEVERVRMPWWGPLFFYFGGKKFAIQAYTLKRKKIRAFLESVGIHFA